MGGSLLANTYLASEKCLRDQICSKQWAGDVNDSPNLWKQKNSEMTYIKN